MSTKKTLNEQIAAARAEVAQKEARVKELLQRQKTEERKARNHRLCKRGGQLESLFPALAKLTEEEFETFVQKTLMTGFAEKVLRGLATEEPAETDTPKPTETTQAVGENNAAGTSAAARVAG